MNSPTYTVLYETLDMMPKDIINIIYDMKKESDEYDEVVKDKWNTHMAKVIGDSIKEWVSEESQFIALTQNDYHKHIWDLNEDSFIPREYIYNPSIYRYVHKCLTESYIGSYSTGLEILNSCNCCSLHIQRRPTDITDIKRVRQYRKERNAHPNECRCLCRHHARNLVELWHLANIC